MNEGVLHEEQVLKRIARWSWEVLGKGQTEVELAIEGTNAVVRGHIDEQAFPLPAGGNNSGLTHVVEVKTMSEDRYRTYLHRGMEAFYPYAIQFSVYMLALKMPGLFVVKNRNTGQIHLTVYEQPIFSYQDIAQRVLAVESCAEKELPKCDDGESYFCRYAYLHERKVKPDTEPFEVTPEFENLLMDFHQCRMEEDVARLKRDRLRTKIIEYVGNHESVETSEFNVSQRGVTKQYLDAKAVRKLLTKQQVDDVTLESTTQYLIVDKKRKR